MSILSHNRTVEDAGGVVINKKTGHIVLIKMHHNVWGFPKGKILKDEGTVDGAKREIYEEAGIDELDYIKELGEYERLNSYNHDEMLKIHMFLFETNQDDVGPIGQDVAEAKWVNKEEVLNILTLEEDKKFFKKIKNKI